jgi:hypothetical protein
MMLQLTGFLKKNGIEKARQTQITIAECFGHLLIIILLGFGYSLSEIFKHPSKQYDVLNIQIPPDFIERKSAASHSQNIGIKNSYDYKINNNMLLKDLQKYLDGPLVVPSFDTYIAMNNFIADRTDESTKSLFSQTGEGQAYSNLLYKGALHFAPYPSKEVESLIDFLNRTTVSFRNMKVYKHASENKAVKYILNNVDDEYALALIVIRDVTPTLVNYVIRQNYTTLPRTNTIIKYPAIKLSGAYQKYFISGFLTLQNTIDDWVFEYTGTSNSSDSCSFPPQISAIPFPTYEYEQNPFYLSVGFLLGLALTSKS